MVSEKDSAQFERIKQSQNSSKQPNKQGKVMLSNNKVHAVVIGAQWGDGKFSLTRKHATLSTLKYEDVHLSVVILN